MARTNQGRFAPKAPAVEDHDPDDKRNRYPAESEGLAGLLAAGYGMIIEEAQTIIKERQANPQMHPYEEFKKAKAMLEAFHATPRAIDTDPGWTRYDDD